MTYRPRPMDTSGVSLPAELQRVTEKLAENVHELWAERRIQHGWVHGAERDDARKTHPGLVPYSELDDSEKAYDRLITLETIKAILALGFRIVKG